MVADDEEQQFVLIGDVTFISSSKPVCSHLWLCVITRLCPSLCLLQRHRAEVLKPNTSSVFTPGRSMFAVGGKIRGGGGHVRIMKLTPLWAGGPARTGNNCSGSTAGCWWCGCSSGPGRAHRARRSGLSSGENRPGSGGVAAARLPSFLNDNKLGVPACNAGWERGGGIGEVCLSLVQVVSRRVPWQRERAFGGEIFLSV